MNEFSAAGLITLIVILLVAWSFFSEPILYFLGLKEREVEVEINDGNQESHISLSDIVDESFIDPIDMENIENAECQSMVDYGDYKVLNGCEGDNFYVRVYTEGEDYLITYCSSGSESVRNRFLKLNSYSFKMQCLDIESDAEFVETIENQIGEMTLYNICGYNVIFLDNECLLGVG